jgi:K+-sensing histidine kinase KdpD
MNNEGIGMGLMICQNLVKKNEGTLDAYSAGEDLGSTFTFSYQAYATGTINKKIWHRDEKHESKKETAG